ncbi:hypothetical protein [Picosynechococcus sp. PCC 8807]|uniref:hypothetical protein n=1 Tax=Picosynechococcus sp. PCC 8807 TaxID=195248 RepID=UPI000810F18C|nr:hypothetical protein [Picosynechococcus sp. PCC 8807]ANV90767.1 hypothetical protein AWQ24_09055 [Picosynechococcus sp. PCC 8807]
MIDTLIKTLKLLGISLLGSAAFFVIFMVATSVDPNNPEDFLAILILVCLAFALEVWVYKRFYKRWHIVFLNFMVTHFASFFAVVPTIFFYRAGYEDTAGLVFFAVWFAIAYFSQSHVRYVERLEQKVKAQQAQIDGFTDQKIQIQKQIETMKTRLDNTRRYGK